MMAGMFAFSGCPSNLYKLDSRHVYSDALQLAAIASWFPWLN
uniref:Uncharacterized protein n=1 Tax=Anguilla anguilla TaxID=7936 RepID=A0A0E9V397_ANGAN